MPPYSTEKLLAASLAALRPLSQKSFVKTLSPPETQALANDFAVWAHRGQLPPAGDWRVWLFLGGRGAGKTRAGAEWVRRLVVSGQAGRIALVGPTLHDVREVMIEGTSGLARLSGPVPRYEASRRRLVWPNGAIAMAFSAEDPASLRGPQFDAAWGDELSYWAHPEAALATLELALRLGDQPRLCLTATPKPLQALKALLARPDVAVTKAGTRANAANLAPGFVSALEARFAGTVYGRQELEGELIEDPEGALWTRAQLEQARAPADQPLDRVIVAVDPPASKGPRADACGIVAAGAFGVGRDRKAVVLADASAKGLSPQQWAERAARLAHSVGASAIIAEANQGGEMVRTVLALAAPDLPVQLVRARVGKRARAEPVAALYAQSRVAHAARFPALEDEMCAFGAPGFAHSPDRMDALVWAITALLLSGGEPRLRTL
jgi:phage terminase large subunit-like protein